MASFAFMLIVSEGLCTTFNSRGILSVAVLSTALVGKFGQFVSILFRVEGGWCPRVAVAVFVVLNLDRCGICRFRSLAYFLARKDGARGIHNQKQHILITH